MNGHNSFRYLLCAFLAVLAPRIANVLMNVGTKEEWEGLVVYISSFVLFYDGFGIKKSLLKVKRGRWYGSTMAARHGEKTLVWSAYCEVFRQERREVRLWCSQDVE